MAEQIKTLMGRFQHGPPLHIHVLYVLYIVFIYRRAPKMENTRTENGSQLISKTHYKISLSFIKPFWAHLALEFPKSDNKA
jgi:hypothetical protein